MFFSRTDEHGLNSREAEKKKNPKLFCDELSKI